MDRVHFFKGVLFFILLFVSSHFYAQDWHLEYIDTTSQYPYKYWVTSQNSQKNSYKLHKKPGNRNSIIKTYSSDKDTIFLINIKIHNLEADTTINLVTNIHGECYPNLKKGKYGIDISTSNYSHFHLDIKVGSNQYVILTVFLAPNNTLTRYQIDSKSPLTPKELKKIIKCIKKNKLDINKCSDGEKYRVSIQI